MTIKKGKILLFVILVALIISFIATGSATAAEGFKISAATVEGGAGGQVTVDITAENAAGSEGGQFILTFDLSLVRPVSVEAGDLVLSAESNLHMVNLDYAPGELMFMWVTANGDTKESGVVCRVTFDLLRDGTTGIGFKDLIIVTGNEQAATFSAGQIKVGTGTPGQDSETDADEDDPTNGDNGEGDEVIDEDDEGENDIVAGQEGFNSFLVIIPIITIVVLSIVYYLIKKPGQKKIGRKDKKQ